MSRLLIFDWIWGQSDLPHLQELGGDVRRRVRGRRRGFAGPWGRTSSGTASTSSTSAMEGANEVTQKTTTTTLPRKSLIEIGLPSLLGPSRSSMTLPFSSWRCRAPWRTSPRAMSGNFVDERLFDLLRQVVVAARPRSRWRACQDLGRPGRGRVEGGRVDRRRRPGRWNFSGRSSSEAVWARWPRSSQCALAGERGDAGLGIVGLDPVERRRGGPPRPSGRAACGVS